MKNDFCKLKVHGMMHDKRCCLVVVTSCVLPGHGHSHHGSEANPRFLRLVLDKQIRRYVVYDISDVDIIIGFTGSALRLRGK
jgi:hypothetical protein